MTRDRDQTPLGTEIERRATVKGWNRETLAFRLGCATRTLARWSTGLTSPRAEHINALKRELDFTEVELNRLLPAAGGYLQCVFVEAAQVLGNMRKLYDEIEEIFAQHPLPPGNDMGSSEKWLSIVEHSAESGFALIKGQKVRAYWFCIAVKDEVYKNILEGENVNASIVPSDVIPLLAPGSYELYFVDFFVRWGDPRVPAFRGLYKGFIRYMIEQAGENVYFTRIAANLTSPAIQSIAYQLGFKEVCTHQHHTMFGDSGARIAVQNFRTCARFNCSRFQN